MDLFQSDHVSCKPISNLSDLLNWPELRKVRRPYRARSLDLSATRSNQNQAQVIVCHDMDNNYHEDRYFQGSGDVASCFNFYHWELIDLFIYFSHHLVTIPPESWLNAAHTNNTRMLGCFITEFEGGKTVWKQMLADPDRLDQVVDILVDITVFYGFDGWLLNIENELEQVEKLKYFVKRLNTQLKKINPELYKVIWYDSVTIEGKLKWQNELNELNAPFFDISDGIFLNYTWNPENLSNSRDNGGSRYQDVFVGIDVFGRGCPGGGGFDCNLALDEIFKQELSVAIFAPGWVYEALPCDEFLENNEKFWRLLSKYLKRRRKYAKLPLTSTFSHGSGTKFFVSGRDVTSVGSGWANLSLQSRLPMISIESCGANWCFKDAFYGGNCISILPGAQVDLFEFDINLLGGQRLILEFVFKDEDEIGENFILSLIIRDDGTEGSETIELVDVHHSHFGNKWRRRRAVYLVKKTSQLVSIRARNKYEEASGSSIRLGYLRLGEPIRETKTDLGLVIEWKTHVFRMDNKNYLGVLLRWNEIGTYYNIFMDMNRDSDLSDDLELRYVGSTQAGTFFMCLSLSENLALDPTLASGQPCLSFNLALQAVDEEATDYFHAGLKELKSSSGAVKNLVRVKDSRVKVRGDSENRKFFEKILFDFETFS